jgi:hypothetical protein
MKLTRNNYLFIIITLTILSICTLKVKADLPVHCLAKHIKGEWTFYLSDDSSQTQKSCGHENPDKNTDHIYSDYKKKFDKKTEISFKLELPNIAYDLSGK